MTLPGQAGKPIGFKTLKEISGYISVHDGNVIKITVNVMKLVKTEQTDPQGLPVYNVSSAINMAAMTKEEYAAVTKGEFAE